MSLCTHCNRLDKISGDGPTLRRVGVLNSAWASLISESGEEAGGDEFFIMPDGIKEVSEAVVTPDRVVKSITARFVIHSQPLAISCRLGIGVFPNTTQTQNPDQEFRPGYVLHQGKGTEQRSVSTENMNAEVVERLTLESSLRWLLDRKELFLMYQPQIDSGLSFHSSIPW
jgi:predicted signal transduction protein with EAL and GGDEF domain